MINNLYDLLQACTARIHTLDSQGTGFFIAPGLLLTCGHVVEPTCPNFKNLTIHYSGQIFPVIRGLKYLPPPYPDLALLQVGFTEHPFVHLNQQVEPHDRLYAYGYPEKFQAGGPMFFEAVGLEQSREGQPFLRLMGDQVIPGASGSPLLSEHTWGVCGMIKYSRDPEQALGGGAIPTSTILKELPELAEQPELQTGHHTLWRELIEKKQHIKPTIRSVDVRLYSHAASVRRPPIFLGRQSLLVDINRRLKETRRVLLVGIGGSGKTASAAMIAYNWLQENPAPVLWVHAGSTDFDMILESLLQCLRAGSQYQDLATTGRLSLGELLDRLQPSLLVIDNAWSGTTLRRFLNEIPPDLPMLVTSREVFPYFQRVEVGDLSQEDALKILGSYAGGIDYHSDPHASRLCEVLSGHAYALEIAGANLAVNPWLTPAGLLDEMAKKPHELEMPAEMAEPGRESVGRLIHFSLAHLQPLEQKVFSVFGSLFMPGATTALLAACLGLEEPKVKPALFELSRHSLITQEQPDYFDLHDLAYSFAHSQYPLTEERQPAMLEAIIAYLAAHAQDNDSLCLDMDNLLAAARIASPPQRLKIMAYIALGGYPLPDGLGYLDERGHTITMLKRLKQAIRDAHEMGSDSTPTLHYLLCKLGNVYFNREDIDNGLAAYREALDLAPNMNRKIKVTAGIGVGLEQKGDKKRANQFLKSAQELAVQEGDENALAFVLQYRSHIAERRGNTATARDFASQAVKINRRLKDELGLAFSLLNLGSTVQSLGNLPKALAYHQEALEVSRRIDRLDLIADVLHALGEDYHILQDRDQAGKHFHAAIMLCHESGDISHEEEIRGFMEKNSYPVPLFSKEEIEDEK